MRETNYTDENQNDLLSSNESKSFDNNESYEGFVGYPDSMDATDVVADCYTDLSKYVAETRAYCSTTDGMKAVFRRALYASAPFKKKVKSAVLVGETLKYHPHGDGNAYSAIISMTCRFGRFPLFDGKGNFGGLGSRPAAMRYTESTISDLGRLMYLKLIDYAEFIDGEAGYKEPKRLPALLPYGLLVGAGGIPVGLPPAVVPQLDSLQLVDYYIAKLKGEEGIVPLPDYGNCIIDVEPDYAREVIRLGRGKLWFKGVIIQEDEHRFVVTEGTPRKSVQKVIDKLKWYIDEEIVDYTDESGDTPRHVFEIYDKSKMTPEELRSIIDKALKCTLSIKNIFVDEDNTAVYCGLDYVVDSSIQYLKECTVRKYQSYVSKTDKLMLVLQAVEDLRNSGKLSEIISLTQEELKDFIVSLGHDDDIAWEATKKPISYLTKSHQSELEELKSDLEVYKRYIEKPEEYLLTVYDELRVKVQQLHSTQTHSIVGENISFEDQECYARLEGNKIVTYDTQVEGSVSWKYNLCILREDGNLERIKLSKVPNTEIEIHDYVPTAIFSDEYKYAIAVSEDCMYSTTHDLTNLKNNWVNDSMRFTRVVLTNEEEISIVERNKEWSYVVNNWIRKKKGTPHKMSSKPILQLGDVTFNG